MCLVISHDPHPFLLSFVSLARRDLYQAPDHQPKTGRQGRCGGQHQCNSSKGDGNHVSLPPLVDSLYNLFAASALTTLVNTISYHDGAEVCPRKKHTHNNTTDMPAADMAHITISHIVFIAVLPPLTLHGYKNHLGLNPG